MGLDFSIYERRDVWHGHITHNLTDIADKCGLYEVLWRPQNIGYECKELVPKLLIGIDKLKGLMPELRKIEPENGWGNCDDLLRFAESVLKKCQEYPDFRFHACV